MGVGVGGDYPMSATVSSDRIKIRKRGTFLAYIFANQGWGSFTGSIVVMVVLAAYKHVMNDKGETSKVDGGSLFLSIASRLPNTEIYLVVWRICVGLSLIPAFGTLYQRLTLGEARRFEKSKLIDGETGEIKKEIDVEVQAVDEEEPRRKKKTHFRGEYIVMSPLCVSFNLLQNSWCICPSGAI
jgi:PHS family inorganic phosphate transporter-like MFS transporter